MKNKNKVTVSIAFPSKDLVGFIGYRFQFGKIASAYKISKSDSGSDLRTRVPIDQAQRDVADRLKNLSDAVELQPVARVDGSDVSWTEAFATINRNVMLRALQPKQSAGTDASNASVGASTSDSAEASDSTTSEDEKATEDIKPVGSGGASSEETNLKDLTSLFSKKERKAR